MSLHTGCAADDQDSAIQYGENTLHLCGKVHMTGGIQQGHFAGITQGKDGLLGKDGDAALPFQRIRVQKGVLVIDAAQMADAAGQIEHGFG